MSTAMSEDAIHIVEAFFNGYIYGLVNDIEAAMHGNANYLAALGLSAYTEILGGFVTGNLGIDGESRQNFDFFLTRYMGQSYQDLIEEKGIDIYKIVRCGLVHEYFIKRQKSGSSAVAMYDVPESNCGIRLFEDYVDGKIEGNKITHTIFVVERYFADFKEGVDKYHKQLVIDRDPTLLTSFFKALQNIQ